MDASADANNDDDDWRPGDPATPRSVVQFAAGFVQLPAIRHYPALAQDSYATSLSANHRASSTINPSDPPSLPPHNPSARHPRVLGLGSENTNDETRNTGCFEARPSSLTRRFPRVWKEEAPATRKSKDSPRKLPMRLGHEGLSEGSKTHASDGPPGSRHASNGPRLPTRSLLTHVPRSLAFTTGLRPPLAFFVKQVEIGVMLMEFGEISANHMLSCAAAAKVGGMVGPSQKY
ncbi:hypothetical protein EAG_07080 [Camponotus floridanus]|uniref:Uncharacterized protein n=1 Tax=Camponotus floridanus TaxID=104421 RepID=E2AJQ2_CAMFO|nr:hypothetical protein EAG_07080 [Camponotus floridanus]